nr:hypothetical protein Iba_chr12bCG25610 [Ipomoea batatas]
MQKRGVFGTQLPNQGDAEGVLDVCNCNLSSMLDEQLGHSSPARYKAASATSSVVKVFPLKFEVSATISSANFLSWVGIVLIPACVRVRAPYKHLRRRASREYHAALLRRNHRPGRVFGAEKCSEQIRLENLVEVLWGGVQDGGVAIPCDACIAEHDVQLSVPGHGGVHCILDVGFESDVAVDK